MRVLFIHPNYHSGGAEIAGNWPPAWVAYLTGPLKKAGYTDVHFCDAMTNKLTDEQVRAEIARLQPDIIGMTAITPSIYKAENLLKIARETVPDAVLVLGGIHATFMYAQVLTEAPWIDVIVRGEGEEIFLNLVQTIDRGEWPANRARLEGLAYRELDADGVRIIATKAAATVKDLDSIDPDWSILEWSKYTYIPMGKRVAIPNMARGCPFTCSFCSQWKFWRDYRIRDPKKVVDEIEALIRDHDVGFFILADEEPTINKKKFVRFCEELIARDLNIPWGINTRVTDILRDEKELALYRKAGLIHVSLGTEAAAQLKLDRFNKETTIEQNKKAIRLLREAGIVVEAQFIVGLENETKETLEETYRMAEDWQPDLANWAMYTPWPFSDLFQDLNDKVEVFDFDKYNFVTPIIKPVAMDRGELLDGVMKNYRRFYMKKALFSYPWAGTGERRKYLLGCLKAFMMAGFKRQFYDLGRVKYWGPQSKGKVDFGFAPNHTGSTARPIAPTPGDWPTAADATRKRAGMKQISPATVAHTDAAKAAVLCGGGTEQMTEEEMDGFVIDHSPEDDAYSVPVAPGLQLSPGNAKEHQPAD